MNWLKARINAILKEWWQAKWELRVLWLFCSGRWYVFRDVPDEIVIRFSVYAPLFDNPKLKELGALAEEEYCHRMRQLDRRLAAVMKERRELL